MMHFLYHVSADQNQDGFVKLYFLDKHTIDICLLKKKIQFLPILFCYLRQGGLTHPSP